MSSIPINQNMGASLDTFCIAYIVNRMRQMGIHTFHFEPYLVVLSKDSHRFHIDGQNEYYYLASVDLETGTEIIADNNYFKVESYYQHIGINNLQEFTGNIEISQPAGDDIQTIEFIRVIPNYI